MKKCTTCGKGFEGSEWQKECTLCYKKKIFSGIKSYKSTNLAEIDSKYNEFSKKIKELGGNVYPHVNHILIEKKIDTQEKTYVVYTFLTIAYDIPSEHEKIVRELP